MEIEHVYFALSDSAVEQTDSGPKLVGYAAKFGVLSEDLGGYKARVNKGAFDKALANGSIILAVVDHDMDKPLGTNDPTVNSLKLSTDDIGLKVEISPPQTTLAADTFANVKGKLKRGMSFSFPTSKATIKWANEGGTKIRDIFSIHKLTEVSVVTHPAFSQTSIAATFSLDHAKESANETTKQTKPMQRKHNMQVSWQAIKSLEEQRAVAFSKAAALRNKESEGLTDDETAELDRLASDVDSYTAKIEDAKSSYFSAPAVRRTSVAESSEHKTPLQTIGFKPKDLQRYSLLRAINKRVNNQPLDGIESEVNEEMTKFAGKPATGFWFPSEMSLGGNERYDLTTSTGTGAVNSQVLTSSFIELLRSNTLVDKLGATYLTNLVGNVSVPKQTSSTGAYWISEGSDTTASNITIGNVALSPKTCGAMTTLSRKFILQTSLSAEAFARNELATTLALEIDRVAFAGSGVSNQPKGIINYGGLFEFTGTLGSLYNDMVTMEGDLEGINALKGSLAYVMRPSVKAILKTTSKVSGQNGFVWEGDSVNGYPAYSSTQIPADVSAYGNKSPVIFGDFSQLVIGLWGGLDINVDTSSGSASGNVKVVALQDVDMVLRNEGAFAACFIPGT